MIIYLELPFLPPTLNTAYVHIPKRKIGNKTVGGGKRLTDEGKNFKAKTKQILIQHARNTGILKNNAALGMCTFFGMPKMLNSGYPDKASNRFKKIDVSNRKKLLEDAIAETIGIDDSQFVYMIDGKYQSSKEETRIWLWNDDANPIASQLNAHFAAIARPIATI